MLGSFRNAINSTVGKVIALGVLVVVALAFAAGDITNVRGDSGSLGGAVAEVGGQKLGESELRQRAQNAFLGYQQQQPGLDMATFVNQGGLAAVVDRAINGLALQEFAESIGMVASKRAIDGEIASIQAFRGLDGKFSQASYDAVLRQQGLTDATLRADIARDMLSRQLIAPTQGASQVATQFALPYASLLLERRQGSVGFIPAAAMGAGTPPTDAELATFYNRNRSRYMVPERRSIRYALVKASDLAATAKATPAEIATAYQNAKTRFAPTEKRTITQVVVAQQALANQIATRVKGGAAIAAAARAAGLEASTATAVDKAAFTAQSAGAVADAAFAAATGAVVGPVRSPLGWHVMRIDGVQAIAGKSLQQATPELTAEIDKTKGLQAVADLRDRLDSAAAENSTFDELMADAKLTPVTTKPLTSAGIDPDAPGQPDPVLARLAQAAFTAVDGDPPQVIQTDADGSFAVVAVGQVVPAAPRPLAAIRDVVTRDFIADRNLRTARGLAIQVVAKANGGTPLAQALAATGARLPAVQPLDATRAQLAQQGQQVPPAIQMMFSMAPKKAKLLEAPDRAGYFVVYLDAIQSANAAGNTALVNSTRAGLGGVIGQEYVEQFASAVRSAVGVKRDAAALAKLRTDLGGTSGAN